MIPQNFKAILSSGEHANLYQIIALFIFLFFFLALIVYVFSRPKKYYKEQENAPLNDDQPFDLKK